MVINKYLAEFLGTFILVFFGSLAILSTLATGGPLLITIGFGFGLALLAGIWVAGHVSGAHFNPAVTLAMLLDGRTSFSDAIGYWVSQFAGAGVASLVVWAASSRLAVAETTTGYEKLSTGILIEVALTAVFVWVILAVTKSGAEPCPPGDRIDFGWRPHRRHPIFGGFGEPGAFLWAGGGLGCAPGPRAAVGVHRLSLGRCPDRLRALPLVPGYRELTCPF